FFIGAVVNAAGQEKNTQKVGLFAFQPATNPAKVYVETLQGFEMISLGGAAAANPVSMVNSDGFVRLYDEPVKDEEGELIYPVIGKIVSNASWNEVFIVLYGELKDGKPSYKGRTIELSKNAFPKGSFKFANFSQRKIRGILGNTKCQIAPNGIDTVRFEDPPGEAIGVKFAYLSPRDNSWAKMISTKWVVPRDGRRIIFAFQNPDNGVMMTKTIPIRD
ncbi:MAG: hypothetical protein AAGC74_13720, partial [Verrucomicrobiota bacterium]